MSDERAVETTQLSRPPQQESSQVSIGYFEPSQLAELAKNGRLYVLADGVGGTALGYVASRYAVKKIINSFFTADTPDLKTRLLEVIRQANVDIFERNVQHPERRPMATTLVAALIHNNKLVVANVGDSRVYVVWDQDIELLGPDTPPATTDAETPADSRQLPPDETETPQKELNDSSKPASLHRLQGLGLEKEIKIDTFSRRLFPGDIVVLCSGGLTGYVQEAEIARAINRHPPDEAIQRLMALAGERGNRDHLAISIARVLSSPVAMRPPAPMPLPAAPNWSDWETLPQPPGLPPTKPLTPTPSKPDPAAEAKRLLAKSRLKPIDRPPRKRWRSCVLAAGLLIFLCVGLLLVGQYVLSSEMAAAVPFLSDIQALLAGETEMSEVSVEIPLEATEPTGQPQTQTEPTGTPQIAPSAAATPVTENNSPLPTPEATFNSPISTPTERARSQGDSVAAATPTPVPVSPTPSPTPLPTIEVPPDCTNKARFRQDVTVPDGTQFTPAERFEKVWLLQNAGTCPWGPGYTVRLIDGDVMGANNQTPLLEEVSPDTNGEISVSMIAPAAPGNYRGDWQLHDLNGEPFGPEMYLEIEVVPSDPSQISEPSLTTLYDFIEKADEATWSSGDTTYTPLESEIDESLDLPVPQGGVAVGPALLRGNVNSEGNVLLTYPHRQTGLIEGIYAVDTPLQPTDALAVTMGFIKLSILSDDGVTFEVVFTPNDGSEQVLLSRTVQYADSPVTQLQPLTGLNSGQTGTFTVRVVGGESLNQDWAVWIDLRLVRLPEEE